MNIDGSYWSLPSRMRATRRGKFGWSLMRKRSRRIVAFSCFNQGRSTLSPSEPTTSAKVKLRPVRIDIMRGIVGFRLLVIRATDQARIAQMDGVALRRQLTFGLNSQWADLPIMEADGFSVTTSSGYEDLFKMLVAGRFDAFPRGLNEARRELDERKDIYPQLAVETTKALYFPYPIYFWVNKSNSALADKIERGLRLSLADGSFRKLFETYHAADIASIRREKRQVILLDNPVLPAGAVPPDTSWWWPGGAEPQ